GSETMIVEEQYDDKKVAKMLLKRNRKKEKRKALKTDLTAEISSVNNESPDERVSCPEAESKVLVEVCDVTSDVNGGSAVETSVTEKKR
nr:hypothetical protein [Vibrio vulnificus]